MRLICKDPCDASTLGIEIEKPNGEVEIVPVELTKINVVYKKEFDVERFHVHCNFEGVHMIDHREHKAPDQVRKEALSKISRGSCET